MAHSIAPRPYGEGSPSSDLNVALIKKSLSPRCPWGERILHYKRVSSTQQVAKQLGRDEQADHLVVIAEEQTNGRGRRDRSWFSPPGSGLYFSVFFRPRIAPGRLQLINLAAALAVREAVRSQWGLDLAIKWPNDLLLGEKKACGILSEGGATSERMIYCCTGIGVNLSTGRDEYEAEGLDQAASLWEGGGQDRREPLCGAIIEGFYSLILSLEKNDGGELLARYRRECSTLGKRVAVLTEEGTYPGLAVAIGDNGELIVKGEGGEKSFCAADVVHASLEGPARF